MVGERPRPAARSPRGAGNGPPGARGTRTNFAAGTARVAPAGAYFGTDAAARAATLSLIARSRRPVELHWIC